MHPGFRLVLLLLFILLHLHRSHFGSSPLVQASTHIYVDDKMWAMILPDDPTPSSRPGRGAPAGRLVQKRPASKPPSEKLVARAKPKAAPKAKAQPQAKAKPKAKSAAMAKASARSMEIKPWLSGPPPAGPVGYASDCSGLDAGAFALLRITSFRHHFASEVDPTYRAILMASHPRINTVFDDMVKRDPQQLALFVGRVTIYTAGFPCPTYSKQGNRHGMDDPSGAGFVIFYVALTIGKLIPDMFILENVPQFANDKKFQKQFDVTMRILYECADGIYNIHWHILNSRDFGVPASRQRLYIVGIRRDRQRAEWTWPVGSGKVSLTSILDRDSPTDAEKQAALGQLKPYQLRNLIAGLEKLNATHQNTANSDNEPWVVDVGKGKSFATSVYLNEMPTITKKRAKELGWFITNRGGLIREHELLKCQGFDPSTIVVPPGVNRSRLREMIGNSYTVNVMEDLFRCGLRALGRDGGN